MQNQKELKRYTSKWMSGAALNGVVIRLTRDDCIRRDVIQAAICGFRTDFNAVEQQWVAFRCRYFCRRFAVTVAAGERWASVDISEEEFKVTAKVVC